MNPLEYLLFGAFFGTIFGVIITLVIFAIARFLRKTR